MIVLKFTLIFLMSMITHHNSLRVSNMVIIYFYNYYSFSASYRATVPENVTIGYIILTVNATDDDIYPNNIICYSILAEVSLYKGI